jgi:DNA primase
MSNLTDFIKYELYPALFERIDIALPEHKFTRYRGGWRSPTYLNGSPHKRPDKTVVSSSAPSRILEQGGDNLSLIDYIKQRDNIEFIEAVKTLAEVVGLQVPDSPDWDPEAYKIAESRAQILEEANQYFIYCLNNDSGAEIVRDYLKNKRGYSPEEILEMELGYIPSQDKVYKYLQGKGFTESQIKDLNFNRIGSSYKLSIPYRSGGSLKGFNFRLIGEAPAGSLKYINSLSTGDKTEGFFNLSGLKGDKDLIIVEGELDSLSAKVRGIDNIVSLGANNINNKQIQTALKRGAKKFTICLDREPAKELDPDSKDNPVNTVNRIISVILVNNVNRIFIAELPESGDKTDPDSFIRDKGVAAVKDVISRAIPYYEFILYKKILPKYEFIKEERSLYPKEVDNLLEEIVETGLRILNPVDKGRYIKAFTDLPDIKELGISEDSLSDVIDKLSYKRDKDKQDRELRDLLIEAKGLQDKGEPDKALELLNKKVNEVKLQDKATEFNKLIVPTNEIEIKERIQNKPESLKSGYHIGGEDLLLPSGALSIFTAPTSHCKTAILLNLALNITDSYPDKKVYLFSYEEDRDSIIFRALNTFLNREISQNNRRSIESYFRTGSTQFIDRDERDYFIGAKDIFFRELIGSGQLNIIYSTYSSDLLIEAIRYLNKQDNVGAILIDYIQLLNLPQGKYKTYSRQEEIKQICLSLKDLSVETGLPLILGAQFNREVDNLLKIHPTNIGEAGDIERVANLIVGLWNNNFKPVGTQGEINEINEKLKQLGINPEERDVIYSKILKNRDGKVGDEGLFTFKSKIQKIEDFKETVDSLNNYMSLGTGGR